MMGTENQMCNILSWIFFKTTKIQLQNTWHEISILLLVMQTVVSFGMLKCNKFTYKINKDTLNTELLNAKMTKEIFTHGLLYQGRL